MPFRILTSHFTQDLKICDLSFNSIRALDPAATCRLLTVCLQLRSLLLYGNLRLLLSHPTTKSLSNDHLDTIRRGMPDELPERIRWCAGLVREEGSERGLEVEKEEEEESFSIKNDGGLESEGGQVDYWSCASRNKVPPPLCMLSNDLPLSLLMFACLVFSLD